MPPPSALTFPIIVLQRHCIWNGNYSHLFPLKSASLSYPPCRANIVSSSLPLSPSLRLYQTENIDPEGPHLYFVSQNGVPRVAHMIFLGARNSWKARRVWPRLHAISCSARRQIGLRYFSDTSHIENKLKKIHSFLWQETWGVFSQYGCVREHTVAVVGPWTFPVEGSKTGFNRSLLLPLEHQLLIFVSIYCRPPYHLHPQRIRF